MKKIFVFLVSVMSLMNYSVEAQGQTNYNSLSSGGTPKHITADRKPAPLADVREADVLYSKTLWRIIDLREKMNQPLYYPTRPMQGRKNLISVLYDGIDNQKITAFDAGNIENEFETPLGINNVNEALGASSQKIQITDPSTGELKDTIVTEDVKTNEVVQLLVKEVWYFDKQASTLNVRIIGICPIREYYRDEDVNREVPLRKLTFWVNYPEVRNLLSKHEVFNPFNDGRNLSFDDVFINRKFDSYIIRESNIYNNRQISQYATGDYLSQESDRIKNEIFNFEQDLWEY